VNAGAPGAPARLFAAVYEDLHRAAKAQMAQERPGHPLQATALVHEAYLRLVAPADSALVFENRRHFLGAAAQAMRRILVEEARRRGSFKRGGGVRVGPLGCGEQAQGVGLPSELSPDLPEVDGAIREFEAVDPQAAEVVRLRFFAGLNNTEIAAALGVSVRTVGSDWNYAKAWLYRRLESGQKGE